MNLKEKTLSGLLWAFSQQFSVQLITVFINIILARLLAPKEFGLIAMLGIFISIGNSLMDSGLTSSLIRVSDADQRDYSTVFIFNLAGSVAFYFIVFFSAPAISHFYNQDILTQVVRVYAITFILNAFFGVQSARLTKEMNFKIQMAIQIPSIIIGGILGVALAYMGYGVWSLVWMNLFQTFLSTVQHWMFSGWRPQLLFDKERFKQHFNFGYKMTLSGLLETVYQNL